jgi:prephenate dehydratase
MNNTTIIARTINASTPLGFSFFDAPIRNVTNIITMGPETTSSYHATTYFASLLQERSAETELNINTYDTLEEVYCRLKEGSGDYAVIPNAYEKVTLFYWDMDFTLAGYFLHPTPEYVLAKRKHSHVPHCPRVASCPAVYQLIDYSIQKGAFTKDYVLIKTGSTDTSAKYVAEMKADLAITNSTSIEKHDLEILIRHYKVPMLWSIFKRK